MVLSLLILILIAASGNFFRGLPKHQKITSFKAYLINHVLRPYLFFCSLFYWQYVPLMVLSILILILIEASGNGHNYQNLPEGQSTQLNKVDEAQLTSAKIMQRTGLLILPMVTKM